MSTASSNQYRSVLRVSLIVGLSLLSLAVCCGLAWWQWQRFESASGTFQNLGYVLQWPLFGLFPAFMFWRLRRLRQRQSAADTDEMSSRDDRGADWGAAVPASVPAPRQLDRTVDPAADEDDELAAYNRYLAELHIRDRDNAR